MLSAVDLEDKKGLWGLAIPAREMLADLLFELGNPKQALAQYERSLRSAPNRFNGLFGAARAAELTGSVQMAAFYYSKLLKSCDGGTHSNRPEIRQAKAFLGLSGVGIGDGRTVGIFWHRVEREIALVRIQPGKPRETYISRSSTEGCEDSV
jgi:tetratricopeptide (TPR) repeat protein